VGGHPVVTGGTEVQRFEYQELVTDMQGGTRVRYVNDREQPDWQKGPRIVDCLSQLATEGWELVSVCMYGGAWAPRLYTLKRPLD
jgi:hypothetical protein